MTDTFTYKAQVSTSGNGEFTVSTAKFGDGYSQDVPDGINNETQKWSVQVSGYRTYVQAVLNFIRNHKGMSFFWKPPLGVIGYYACKRYSLGDAGGAYWTVTFEFEEVKRP